MFQDYDAVKKLVSKKVVDLEEFLRKRGSDRLAGEASELVSKLEENCFNLVVMGEFKRGKTTFVNALIGATLLPTAITPLTSIVTELVYGEELAVEVHFLDGRTKKASLEELPGFVTERGNPENVKGVKLVRAFYPSPYLRDGVRLVDTPGVGSVYDHNTEVAYDYLPKADAGIFLLTADPPISKSELEFLLDVKEQIGKVFFVLNKIDHHTEEERRESLEFCRQSISNALGLDGIKLFPLSARWALEAKTGGASELLETSLLPDFERSLEKFLVEEKGTLFLTSSINKALRMAQDEIRVIELEAKSLETPLKLLEERLAAFREAMEGIERKKLDNHYLMQGQVDELIKELDEDLDRLKLEKVSELKEDLRRKFETVKSRSVKEIGEALDDHIRASIKGVFDAWRAQEDKLLSEKFERVAERFTGEANALAREIVELSSSIFDIPLAPSVEAEDLSKESRFYYHMWELTTTIDQTISAVRRLLPKGIAAGLALKDAERKLAEYFDRQCGRVRYDFVERLKKSLLSLKVKLDEKIDDTAAGIALAVERAMEGKKKGERELAEEKERLDVERKELEKIAEDLESIAKTKLGIQK